MVLSVKLVELCVHNIAKKIIKKRPENESRTLIEY
jgi:ABC-type Zn uptake system ZnuABC Zn-binding protein ZnuA